MPSCFACFVHAPELVVSSKRSALTSPVHPTQLSRMLKIWGLPALNVRITLCMLWCRYLVDRLRNWWRLGPSSASLAMSRGPVPPQMTQSRRQLSRTSCLADAITKLGKGNQSVSLVSSCHMCYVWPLLVWFTIRCAVGISAVRVLLLACICSFSTIPETLLTVLPIWTRDTNHRPKQEVLQGPIHDDANLAPWEVVCFMND